VLPTISKISDGYAQEEGGVEGYGVPGMGACSIRLLLVFPEWLEVFSASEYDTQAVMGLVYNSKATGQKLGLARCFIRIWILS
jgi:hypothetical protein